MPYLALLAAATAPCALYLATVPVGSVRVGGPRQAVPQLAVVAAPAGHMWDNVDVDAVNMVGGIRHCSQHAHCQDATACPLSPFGEGGQV